MHNQSNISQDYMNFSDRVMVSEVMQQPAQNCIVFNFMFYTLLIGAISILGILGNILSIAVLQKDRNNRVAAFLLQSLAFVDTCVLLMSLFILSVIYGLFPYTGQSNLVGKMIPYVVKYVHPVGYMAQCGTIWITVLLAVNRYIAIVKPFHAVSWCGLSRARKQVLVVLLFTVSLNFPRYFQYQINYNVTEIETKVSFAETEIGESTIFGVVYTNIIYTVVVLLIPLVILVIMNSRLIHEIKFANRNRTVKSITNSKIKFNLPGFQRKGSFSKPPLPEEDNITFIMVIIIVILIVCHTPDRIFFIYRYFFTDREQLKCGETLYYISSICNLLIVINSSCNFMIYFLVRRRFRKIFFVKICAWCKLEQIRRMSTFSESSTPSSLARRMTDGAVLEHKESNDTPFPLLRRSTII